MRHSPAIEVAAADIIKKNLRTQLIGSSAALTKAVCQSTVERFFDGLKQRPALCQGKE
jgi:hypothetical protein